MTATRSSERASVKKILGVERCYQAIPDDCIILKNIGAVPGAVATGRLRSALSAGARSLPLPVPYRRVRKCWLFRFRFTPAKTSSVIEVAPKINVISFSFSCLRVLMRVPRAAIDNHRNSG